jgi:hypothetical protein
METIRCYRFVKDDLRSEHGEMSWTIGEWNRVDGKIVCCTNGIHAALTPRDSLRNVYGQRWFISEAKGDIVHQDSKFAAREMRLVEEIPKAVLQSFALWCARDSLRYYEDKYPEDSRMIDCIRAAEGHLEGTVTADELAQRRAKLIATADAHAGAVVGRAVVAAAAAALAAVSHHPAAWAAAAAAGAYAAHAAAAAVVAGRFASDAVAGAHDAVAAVAAADTTDVAAAAAHAAAAAAAQAHAAAVAAAHGLAVAEPADPYAAAHAAAAHVPARAAYTAQTDKLLAMISASTAK